MYVSVSALVGILLGLNHHGAAFNGGCRASHKNVPKAPASVSRKVALGELLAPLCFSVVAGAPGKAFALKDCFEDCLSNCNRVAPKSKAYCTSTCEEYCAQGDRKDGLSGSASSENAEIGWYSYLNIESRLKGETAGVVYGEDKPPDLGVDLFGINQMLKGKKR